MAATEKGRMREDQRRIQVALFEQALRAIGVGDDGFDQARTLADATLLTVVAQPMRDEVNVSWRVMCRR
jgi:hypothetical protein